MRCYFTFCILFLFACGETKQELKELSPHTQDLYLFGNFYSTNPEIKLALKTNFSYELRFINGRCTGDFVRIGYWTVQNDSIFLSETGDSIPSMCMGGPFGIDFISQKQEQPIYIHHRDTLGLGKTRLIRMDADSQGAF